MLLANEYNPACFEANTHEMIANGYTMQEVSNILIPQVVKVSNKLHEAWRNYKRENLSMYVDSKPIMPHNFITIG